MKRIYHPFNLWEDFQNGMYEMGEHEGLEEAKTLLSNPDELKKIMIIVCGEWIYSGEVNLSNRSRNRQAWLGQAACSYNSKTTEEVTRIAWGELTDQQREDANKVADEVIARWEKLHNQKICQKNI